jgi:hypothetical protein
MPYPIIETIRALRRKQAEERQAIYDSLTIEEKIELCESRPGNCARELARLYAQLEA